MAVAQDTAITIYDVDPDSVTLDQILAVRVAAERRYDIPTLRACDRALRGPGEASRRSGRRVVALVWAKRGPL